MPFGKESLAKLETCDPRLITFAKAVMEGVDRGDLMTDDVADLTILWGHRGEKDQNEAFAKGTSEKQWPNSKHNKLPSLAVDMVPYPINWAKEKLYRFEALRRYARGVAQGLGIRIRIISWDWPHYELAVS